MSVPVNVLVTAVAGDLGQAVVKALRLSARPIISHGCDMDETGYGSAFVNSFNVVPHGDDPNYVEVLDQLCRSLEVDAVVPCSEQEIYRLSGLGICPRLACGIPVVCQTADWVHMYGDKLTCMNALSGKIDLAPFSDGSDHKATEKLLQEAGFPVVVKSRRSSGSRSLVLAANDAELNAAIRATSFPMVQALIDASEGEFSVGVFACDQFSTAIAFKRVLGRVGVSWFAETSKDKSVLDYSMEIARLTGLKGSANIQVRKSSKGVRLLEINPRFSSLAAARAACGFYDVEWSVELAFGVTPEKPANHFRQIRFQRFFHELVDLGDGFKAVSEWCPDQAPISRR